MTDKELRKLSRLELLELLLEASKENEKLKEKIEKLTEENTAAKRIDNLTEAAKQVNSSLKYVNNLCLSLNVTPDENLQEALSTAEEITEENTEQEELTAEKEFSEEKTAEDGINSEEEKTEEDDSEAEAENNILKNTTDGISDKDLYCRIMNFYAKNTDVMKTLPYDIRIDIIKRINSIMKNRLNSSIQSMKQ